MHQSPARLIADYDARRETASWPGIAAESVEIGPADSYEFHFSGPLHLLCISEGSYRVAGETRVDGLKSRLCQVVKGTMVFVPSGALLTGWSRRKQSSSWFYIYLDPRHFAFASASDLAPRLFFSDPELYSTASKVKRLMRAPHEESALHAETLGTLLSLELSSARTLASAGGCAQGGLSARCAATLRDYMHDNIARRVRVADLSALARLSPYHFVRAFKRSFGFPPHQYLTRCRIERAKQLLAETSQSTTEISLAVGLGGSSHFATTFKAVTGVSPLVYRRSVAGEG